MIQNLFLAYESYAPKDWCFRNLYSCFSRLYYILDGEAYYEENGKTVRLKKHHLYLTPVKQKFDLYHNPDDRLLHTHAHIITSTEARTLTEIEVVDGTPLADAVALWRKYIFEPSKALQISTAQFVLSCTELSTSQQVLSPAQAIKEYIDGLGTTPLHMKDASWALGYTREHLTRIFSTTFGCTPRQYFNARRMEFAIKKLQSGISIKEVAFDLGFSSDHAFNKAFRKHFGLPPHKFLISIKKDEK